MTGIALALVAGLGTYYLYTAAAMGWSGLGLGQATRAGRAPLAVRVRDGQIRRLVQVSAAGGVTAFVAIYLLLGAWLPALAAGLACAASGPARHERRSRRHADLARQEWPRMLEELRVLIGSAGRSIPGALFEVGTRAPESMQPAFDEAQREWLLTTDFPRTLRLLKTRLDDATADAVCETLLVAHEVGGSDVTRRIQHLVEDRTVDLAHRRNADARQSGARFARRFVLIVPAGMAMVGMSIGSGRAAYQSAAGQVMVVAALGLIGICWWWAGRILRLPDEERILTS